MEQLPFIAATPVLAILVSLLAVPLIIISGQKHQNLREFWTFLAGGIKLLLVLSMAGWVLAGNSHTYELWQILPGISIKFTVDGFGMLFALVASFLWIITSVYSIGYMRGLNEHAQTRYFVFFAVALSATIGVAFAGNLLTLYIFYEILSLSTYPLVTHHQDKEARTGGRKYLTYLLGTSIMLALPAMIITYQLTGSLEFSSLGVFMDSGVSKTMLTILLFMFLFGFAKNGVMPFHAWLPGAMVAPTPVSALLHAVAVVKVGVFASSRVMLHIFGVDIMSDFNLGISVAYLASFTILVSSIIALTKDNLKARLAYSTVSQLSYIILGIALLTPAAIDGGLIHIANHAFAKITLFFCAGAIFVASSKKYISEMDGLGRTMPFTFAAFAIASLSMIGVPPAAGFVTKWQLLVGTMQMESHYIVILLVLLSSTMLNVAYFAPITYRAFFVRHQPIKESHQGIKEAPLAMIVPIMIAAFISVFIGIYPDVFMNFVSLVTR